MIKVGIFDVAGVLHEVVSSYIYQDIIQTFEIRKDVFKKAWPDLAGKLGRGEITEEEFWRLFLKKINTSNPLPKKSLFLRKFIEHYEPKEGVLDLINKLKHKGLKVAVLSNTIMPHAEYLDKIGLYQNFDKVYLSHEVGVLKPDPQIYKHVLKELKVLPEEVFFVDDKPVNIEAAARLGIHAILFKDAVQLATDLKKLGVKFN